MASTTGLVALVGRRGSSLLLSTRRFAATAAASSSVVGKDPRFPAPPPPRADPLESRIPRHKEKWGRPFDPDADYFVLYPSELGRNSELNWALAKYQITPRSQAFRNLHVRGIQMFIEGRDKQSKASHVTVPAGKQEHFVVGLKDAEGKPVAFGKAVPHDQFKTLFREVRKQLSDIDRLFVHDARLGAQKTRIYTDSAAVALAAKHILLPTPLGRPGDFEPQLSVYVVSSLGDSVLKSIGLGTNFTLFDVERNNVFVVGNPSTAALRDALSHWASFAQQASGLVLPADVLASGNRKILVLNQEGSFLKNLYDKVSPGLAAANNVIWTEKGLALLWKGASVARTGASEGDLVENKSVVTSALPPVDVSGHPTTIVFFGEDINGVSDGVSKLSAKQAINNFQELLKSRSLFGQDAAQLASRFEELVKQSKAQAVLFNKKGGEDAFAKFKTLLDNNNNASA